MTNHQLGPVALASVVLAGGLAVHAIPGPFGWLQTLTGIVLLLILFAYDTEDQRSAVQSFAFATVCGFCLMLFASGFIERWASGPGTVQVAVPGSWLSVIWVGGALVFFFIDLMRMGSRGTMQSPAAIAAPRPTRTVPSTPVPPFMEAPPVQKRSPETPSFTPRVEEPVAVPNPPEAATVEPVSTPAQPAAAPPSGPPPKVVGIYVNLLGEGLNMMRAVAAQDLGRGYYLIVEPMPEGETWQFQTGQVVRCQKKNLANGKHLVAFEEAPRA